MRTGSVPAGYPPFNSNEANGVSCLREKAAGLLGPCDPFDASHACSSIAWLDSPIRPQQGYTSSGSLVDADIMLFLPALDADVQPVYVSGDSPQPLPRPRSSCTQALLDEVLDLTLPRDSSEACSAPAFQPARASARLCTPPSEGQHVGLFGLPSIPGTPQPYSGCRDDGQLWQCLPACTVIPCLLAHAPYSAARSSRAATAACRDGQSKRSSPGSSWCCRGAASCLPAALLLSSTHCHLDWAPVGLASNRTEPGCACSHAQHAALGGALWGSTQQKLQAHLQGPLLRQRQRLGCVRASPPPQAPQSMASAPCPA